eukprot:5290105-Pyramimonas_sp.AAC.1
MATTPVVGTGSKGEHAPEAPEAAPAADEDKGTSKVPERSEGDGGQFSFGDFEDGSRTKMSIPPLQERMLRRKAGSADSEVEPEKKVQRKAADGRAAPSRRTDKPCPVTSCEEQVHGNKKHCKAHHRIYECLRNHSLKGVDDLDEKTETEESKSFKAIFGHRGKKGSKNYDGDPEIASQVLEDVRKKHPDMDDAGGSGARSTKARGTDISLSTYVNRRGTEKSKSEVSARPKWDFELFSCQMELLRRWTPTKIKQEWAQLEENTPDDQKDN